MTITEAAEYLKEKPEKILKLVKSKYPDRQWSTNSDLPEEFVETVENKAQEYQQTMPQIEGKLTVAQSAQILSESIEYGFLEAFQSFEIAIFAKAGEIQGHQKVQAFEAGENAVMDDYFNRRFQAGKAQLQQLDAVAQSFLPAAQKRQAQKVKLSQKTAEIQQMLVKFPKL